MPPSAGPGASPSLPAALDLRQAVVVSPSATSELGKAAAMLVEEVQKRTRIRWRQSSNWPSDSTPVIAVGPLSDLSRFAGRYAPPLTIGQHEPEGYQIRVVEGRAAPTVLVAGNDPRGALFGVGRLLRELRLGRDRVALASDLSLYTAPRYALRGHQLGYRPKTNSYDGWTLPMWEQYIRDLVVFGANAVELIPPRSDDDDDSPHFPLPPMEMMVGMSQILADYGLDVWIWYPAMDQDYSDPGTVEFALKEWGEVFRQLPRVDAVFVPGGDPGHTPPQPLMALLEKQTGVLHRFHPHAQMWVSPQSFNQQWLDELLNILKAEEPTWLSGVVYGPQTRGSLQQLRTAVPARYPIRHYPDITHSRQCQYPVPNWDIAHALTEGREGINPRPKEQARIFELTKEATVGFLTYSEGCNDDLNKAVWSALGWDPGVDVSEVLRQYSRYFIGDRWADDFAQGLLALERNWQGPLLTNGDVYTTLAQFQSMERSATPQERLNWRFQQALYRAYYDAYTRSRLLHETGLEERAMDTLRGAREVGSLVAMTEAEAVLDRAVTHRVSQDWRARVFELAEALYQSIRMQLSVERYAAIAVGRGANLDTLDYPLNNRLWLKQRFAELRQLAAEAERLQGISDIVNWTNPGPGGFYDDLGDPNRQPHLVRGPGFSEDPEFLESALIGFRSQSDARISWRRHAESLFDAPLTLRYTGLDPAAAYQLRVVYFGDSPQRKIRLVANDEVEIHPFILKPTPVQPVEFAVPPEATRGSELTLRWFREPGQGGNGRGCQVAEVWLIKRRGRERP